MHGKICLVTGGTSGLGRAVAMTLARAGATVMLTGRNRLRGEAAVADIRALGGQAEFLPADFSSLRAVRDLAAAVRARHDRLHVLVHNAGIIGPGQRQLGADGIERTFAVNHLAVFALNALLHRHLIAAAPARVVVVSSDAHRGARRLPLDDLGAERGYRPFRAYCQSKLANVLFTFELARRMAGLGVTANCLHPGVVCTPLWDEAGGILGFFGRLTRPFMISPERGGASVARLAMDPALEGVTGRYFHGDHEAAASASARDLSAAEELWNVSDRLVRDHLSDD